MAAHAGPRGRKGRLQLEPNKDTNAKVGEGLNTDALDSIALTLALEFPMLIDGGARERMLERRRRYGREPVRSCRHGQRLQPGVRRGAVIGADRGDSAAIK
jgi:hypothetical protein